MTDERLKGMLVHSGRMTVRTGGTGGCMEVICKNSDGHKRSEAAGPAAIGIRKGLVNVLSGRTHGAPRMYGTSVYNVVLYP